MDPYAFLVNELTHSKKNFHLLYLVECGCPLSNLSLHLFNSDYFDSDHNRTNMNVQLWWG